MPPRRWWLIIAALSLSVAEGARNSYGGRSRIKLRTPSPPPPKDQTEAELEKAVAVNNDAIQAMFDSTKDRCSNEGEDNLAEDVRQLCMQTQPRSMLALMFEKLQKKSKDVALWLCSAAETTVDKDWSTHYSERLACDEAASSTIGAMMSLDDPNQTLIGKIAAVARFTVWSAKFALIVATPFIPLPFGFLGRLFLDAVISQLTGDAEKELDLVEKQMKKRIEEISRRTAQRVQVEEAFRIGSAHARAANDQIKDMAMIDHLWSSSMTAMSEHGASKDSALLWSTMKQVTSFNRWAIIEHDLAMCIEVLMPADSLDLEDRATFAKLMKVHFEMYVLVLSHMNAAGDATQNVEEMQAELSKKATRMASITLPQLVLLSIAVEPGQDLKSVHTMFDSDLLPVNVSHAEAEGCGFLHNETDYEFEFLATCVWLPFLRTSEAWATPLPAPSLLTSRGVDTDRPDANSYEYWHDTGPLTSRETPQIEMETEELRIGCAPGQFLAGVEYAYKQSESGSWTASRMQHFLTGACRSDDTVETAANGQFTTAGICTDVVTLFSDHTLAVMISLTFQRRGDGAATIKSSTCQLAYQRSTVGPYLVPGTSSVEKYDIFCEKDCDATSLMARGDYAYIRRVGHHSKVSKEGEVDVWQWSKRLGRLQWIRAIQGPSSCSLSGATPCSITAVTMARNYMVFGLSTGKVSWVSIEFDYHFLPGISVGELGAKSRPITSLAASGGFVFAASNRAMLVYMISMMPRPISLSKKFLVLPSMQTMKDGVSGLTVVAGHMYIASTRHIHRISIETQESAFAARGQGSSPTLSGVQDGFLYVSWTGLGKHRWQEELTKVPLLFQGAEDMVHVMPLDPSIYAASPAVVTSSHAYQATNRGAMELDLASGEKKGVSVEMCSNCFPLNMAVWWGRIYQATARLEAGQTLLARGIHPDVQKWLDDRNITNPLLALLS